jgi:hypothetical protein
MDGTPGVDKRARAFYVKNDSESSTGRDQRSEVSAGVFREVSCDFVDRLSIKAKRTIHEITRNLTKYAGADL